MALIIFNTREISTFFHTGHQQGHVIVEHFNKASVDEKTHFFSTGFDDPDFARFQGRNDRRMIVQHFELPCAARHFYRFYFTGKYFFSGERMVRFIILVVSGFQGFRVFGFQGYNNPETRKP